jgi:hypothetical protein
MLDTPFDTQMSGDLGQSGIFGQDTGYNGGPMFGQDSMFGQDFMLDAVEGAIDAGDPYAIGQTLGLMGAGNTHMESWIYDSPDPLF